MDDSSRSAGSPAVRVGTDLVAVGRVQRLIDESPGALESIYTAAELRRCGGRAERLAARFAAKEAVLKSLGVGFAAGVNPRQVEILGDPGGRPRVRLHGRAQALASAHGVREVDVSMSHSAGLALACAVATGQSAGFPASAGRSSHREGEVG